MRPRSGKLVLAVLLLLASAPAAFPGGREGHAAVGEAARARLGESARAHVVRILGNDDLGAVASWMDELRSASFHTGALAFDPEAQAFIREFPKNGEWHYVDLPLGTKAYDPDGPFSRPDDVVHEVGRAVADPFRGQRRRPDQQGRSPSTCWCTSSGDLHQPLHVGNGFYEVADDGKVRLVTDPAAARSLPNDKGGNALFFGPGRYDELHAYWDVALVTKVTGSENVAELVKALQASDPRRRQLEEPGRLSPLGRGMGHGKHCRGPDRLFRDHLREGDPRSQGRDPEDKHHPASAL